MEIVTKTVAQYSHCECIGLHRVPTSITNQDLREKFVQVLSLKGVSINQDNTMQCHRLKKKTYVIVKLKEQQKRYNIMVNRSKLKGKNDHLHFELVLRMQYLLMQVTALVKTIYTIFVSGC